jgi:predicted transcriptional regulator
VASAAENVGHLEPVLGEPVTMTDRLTAAASPVAAFAEAMQIVERIRREAGEVDRAVLDRLPLWRARRSAGEGHL